MSVVGLERSSQQSSITVIPAEAGTHTGSLNGKNFSRWRIWIPACAGMTMV